MRHILTIKGGIGLAAVVAMLLAAGAAIYATQRAFDVTITGNVNLVVTGDPIQIFSGDGVTLVKSGDTLDFGTAAVDFFGRGPVPVRGPFFVKNLSNGPVQVVVTGDGGDNIIPLWGPTQSDLKPWPDNAFTLSAPGLTGDTMKGYLGLRFLAPTTGSKSTTIIFRATVTTGDMGPAPIQPPPGMVSWWPGDGNANDIVGSNHGTLTGDYAQGMVGQGFSLDGTGDFVLVADNPNLNITGDMTVDLWAKRTVFSRFVGTVV